MNARLADEQRRAIAAERHEQWLREELQEGFDTAERGEIGQCKLDEFLANARRRLA